MYRIKTMLFATFLLLMIAIPCFAVPVTGYYNSTDLGGQLLTGRASTNRTGINSGFPHVFHVQSWDGTNLGTQWELSCGKSNGYSSVVDNRVAGVGDIVYTSIYTGGTFTFFPGGWPWGSGTGTLNNTSLTTTVTYIMISGNSTPVGARINGTASGVFAGGCALSFAIANGNGVGETTSLNPLIVKPANYPTFLDGTCNLASPTQQFGTWGGVTQILFGIECPTPTRSSSWGQVKLIYK